MIWGILYGLGALIAWPRIAAFMLRDISGENPAFWDGGDWAFGLSLGGLASTIWPLWAAIGLVRWSFGRITRFAAREAPALHDLLIFLVAGRKAARENRANRHGQRKAHAAYLRMEHRTKINEMERANGLDLTNW
jgi:hypothetical protein